MILTRLGNKRGIAHKIIPHFPPHKTYIEPFFGAGGMFFSKPKAKYNILNDLDSEVYNLFWVVRTFPEELERQLKEMPIHQELFNYWKDNHETDAVMKACRFLLLSNFSFLGKMDTMVVEPYNVMNKTVFRIPVASVWLENSKFLNSDFKSFFQLIVANSFKDALIYCDPPYLETGNNYSSGFTEQNSSDLFDCLVKTGANFAMSEFDHPFILEMAKTHGLNVIEIGSRSNLKNTRTEILITNYEKQCPTLF